MFIIWILKTKVTESKKPERDGTHCGDGGTIDYQRDHYRVIAQMGFSIRDRGFRDSGVIWATWMLWTQNWSTFLGFQAKFVKLLGLGQNCYDILFFFQVKICQNCDFWLFWSQFFRVQVERFCQNLGFKVKICQYFRVRSKFWLNEVKKFQNFGFFRSTFVQIVGFSGGTVTIYDRGHWHRCPSITTSLLTAINFNQPMETIIYIH